jgi:glutamate dehydrogenase (NAD(P)+)
MPETRKVRPSLFDEAADRLGLDATLREFLSMPEHEHHATLPIRLDDGSAAIVRSHRVQYSSARGPTIGAMRWHPDASEESTRAEAAAATWQAALLDLPHGGAAGAVSVDPKELSPFEKERLARELATRFRDLIGRGKDILIGGTNVTPQILGWVAAASEVLGGPGGLAATAGKPVALGGSMVPAEASARSAVISVREWASARGIDPGRLSYGVVGFGSLGRRVADQHARILGGSLRVASDSRGAVRQSGGIEPAALVRHKVTLGQVSGFDGTDALGAHEAYAEEVDVLYLAAASHLIGEDAAPVIRARVLCELCPSSVDRPGDAALNRAGKTVIPSLLATGGRLIAAHCESGMGVGHGVLTHREVEHRIAIGVTGALQAASSVAAAEAITLRTAAWMVGIERVAEAARARGWC